MRGVVELAPIVKTVELAVPRETAFEVFVGGIGAWWPLATHTRARLALGQTTEDVIIERRVGGRMFERLTDGTELDWGSVLAFEPPSRLAISWRMGRPAAAATTVELAFETRGPDRCRVTLTHRDWERLGAEADALRGSYDKGWDTVFGTCYRSAAEARS